ncbi:uncharacterized protein [Panulirus ornatus]|uniref:uncharacterized protein n=1 Tax=Panulirus ornatus TaxID=150431 RepID=UPI003A884C1F
MIYRLCIALALSVLVLQGSTALLHHRVKLRLERVEPLVYKQYLLRSFLSWLPLVKRWVEPQEANLWSTEGPADPSFPWSDVPLVGHVMKAISDYHRLNIFRRYLGIAVMGEHTTFQLLAMAQAYFVSVTILFYSVLRRFSVRVQWRELPQDRMCPWHNYSSAFEPLSDDEEGEEEEEDKEEEKKEEEETIPTNEGVTAGYEARQPPVTGVLSDTKGVPVRLHFNMYLRTGYHSVADQAYLRSILVTTNVPIEYGTLRDLLKDTVFSVHVMSYSHIDFLYYVRDVVYDFAQRHGNGNYSVKTINIPMWV